MTCGHGTAWKLSKGKYLHRYFKWKKYMYTPEPRDSKEYPNFTQTVSNYAESN